MSTPDQDALRTHVAGFMPEERRDAARQEAERLEKECLDAERAEADHLAVDQRTEEEHAEPSAAQITEATTTLHTQAMGILNVKYLVPVTHDLASSHYNRWRGFFLNTL